MIAALLAGTLGLCWGSFLNVVAVRTIRGDSLWPSSCCPHCAASLAWYDLIPIFSWFMLAGKCRSCRASIPFWYPAIEGITALSAIALIQSDISPSNMVIRAFLASCCIVTLRTDGEHQLLVVPIMRAIALGGLAGSFFDPQGICAGFSNRFIGATIGFGAIWALGYIYTKIRGRIGIGEGDAELLGSLGMALGPAGILSVFFCAPLIGIVHILYLAATQKISSSTPVPFGAYCAAIALIELVTNGYFSQLIVLL